MDHRFSWPQIYKLNQAIKKPQIFLFGNVLQSLLTLCFLSLDSFEFLPYEA